MTDLGTAPVIDSRLFRDAMGQFATGVTIVTVGSVQDPWAMTVNAFSSVSLDPPMLLVCIGKSARSHGLLADVATFGVSILDESQRAVSDACARSDRSEGLAGVSFRGARRGTPVLDDALAQIECEIVHRYDGGDHTILVGQVIDVTINRTPEAGPLLFFQGRYRALN